MCILSTIENEENYFFKGTFHFGNEYNYKQIFYHKNLLIQAGYIKTDVYEENNEKFSITELTWQGYEYLEELKKTLEIKNIPQYIRKNINRI
ncbi:hypothetical protein GXM_10048 [Nostoc sphaeroides CCNUC1]|uniref:Uncharacterized protein n=2 Tax=Nostoc sphaeroides TaxID=446679 RepID=A0A5P8WJ84_9NOSO|nr:hypothetical protein GXM_10048 [Nostoc sphaeroides CCNUC1]